MGGGLAIPPSAVTAKAIRRALKRPIAPSGLCVLTFGDSITNTNVTVGANDTAHNAVGILTNYQWMAGRPFAAVIDKGVDANTTVQMSARYEADVAANYDAFDVLWYWGGTNDIRANLLPGDIFGRIKTDVEKALSAGKLVTLFTAMATGGAFALTTQQLKRLNHLNRLICDYALKTSGVLLVDAFRATCIPLTGLADPTKLYDMLHPNASGGWEVARLVHRVLTPALPIRQFRSRGVADVYDAVDNPLGNRLTNGCFLGTTGAKGSLATGNLADSWQLAKYTGQAASAHWACTKEAQVAGADAYMGERQIFTLNIPQVSGSTMEQILMEQTVLGTINGGEQYVARMEVEISGMSGNWVTMHLRLQEDDGTGSVKSVTDGANGAYQEVKNGKLYMETPVLTTRPVGGGGSRYLNTQFFMMGNPAGANLQAVIKFAEAEIRRVA